MGEDECSRASASPPKKNWHNIFDMMFHAILFLGLAALQDAWLFQ